MSAAAPTLAPDLVEGLRRLKLAATAGHLRFALGSGSQLGSNE
jgi:hypothetical protein